MECRCVQCLHLRMRNADVADRPRVVPANIRRASRRLVSMFGPKLSIVRREAACYHDRLPARSYPIHRVRNLSVVDCPSAQLDPDNEQAVLSSLPHELSYWINGRLIHARDLRPLADKINSATPTERGRIANLLRRHGVSLKGAGKP